MNRVENITQKILDEANLLAADKEQEAKAEADALLKSYEAEANKEYEKISETAKKEAQALLDRVLSQSQMNNRNLKLRYRRTAIEQAFAKALEGLCSLPQESMIGLLASLIIKYQTVDAQIILSAKDQDLVPKVIAAVKEKRGSNDTTLVGKIGTLIETAIGTKPAPLKLVPSEKVGTFQGGVVIVEGNVETNCSFEVLLGSSHDSLEAEVAAILFS